MKKCSCHAGFPVWVMFSPNININAIHIEIDLSLSVRKCLD